jgi:hypothetical protein
MSGMRGHCESLPVIKVHGAGADVGVRTRERAQRGAARMHQPQIIYWRTT